MKVVINDGGAAFPHEETEDYYPQTGMSLRAYFAAKNLAAEISLQGMEGCDAEQMAGMAVELADALIAELAKTK